MIVYLPRYTMNILRIMDIRIEFLFHLMFSVVNLFLIFFYRYVIYAKLFGYSCRSISSVYPMISLIRHGSCNIPPGSKLPAQCSSKTYILRSFADTWHNQLQTGQTDISLGTHLLQAGTHLGSRMWLHSICSYMHA